jgi:hypothetical protein
VANDSQVGLFAAYAFYCESAVAAMPCRWLLISAAGGWQHGVTAVFGAR